MEKAIKKIAVIGPECTGKSTLCKELAAHFQTVWVPEFARSYLLQRDHKYGFDDLKIIAEGQVKAEDEIIDSFVSSLEENTDRIIHPVFIDTDMYVMKVWSEYVFNACDNSILASIATRSYDLYLLCYPDLPWVPDPLREHPDEKERMKIYHYYKDAIINQPAPWIEVKGDYALRMDTSIDAVKKMMC
ncbi:MAG: ATP-binding protein [Ferruginibacter sp.]|nr:ATP-binding protein [Ferruginibacter sp.]